MRELDEGGIFKYTVILRQKMKINMRLCNDFFFFIENKPFFGFKLSSIFRQSLMLLGS